ncbi:hypothetical protein PsorP6_012068 [Peronosclerospora sorghi]|uniref:Uncharacterized protein n=1 Tax=Peronosclerospora sorghi TaxID=230839 RepID=A0ACC0WKJ5_9STRA|nr:hypothetical protein PsorP6_012068 [Peronosclerospora sorghi]
MVILNKRYNLYKGSLRHTKLLFESRFIKLIYVEIENIRRPSNGVSCEGWLHFTFYAASGTEVRPSLCIRSIMAHSLRSLRLRWIIVLFAAGVIFILSDMLVTWQQLLTLKGPSTWPSLSLSTRGASRASVATLHALRYTAFSSMDSSQVQLLYTLTRRTTETRGIVVPLNSATASQGLSLVMELRSLGVTLPVEIPHCGDLDQKWITSISKKEKELGRLYVYDVCKMAFMEKTRNQSIFCDTLEACYDRFRTHDLTVLAVIFSRFEELLLLGANTLLLQSPMSLWETSKYQTGTLFFNDRVSETNTSLSYRPASRPHVTDLRHYLSNVNVSVFRHVPTIPRPKATVVCDTVLPFKPSDMLLKSHAWNGRSSHQLDSSLLLWSKKQQPRATVVLAAFLLRNGLDRPPFSGVNELFFVACELAETQYSFSELAQGAAGNDFMDHGAEKSIICGLSTQFYPVKQEDASYAPLLYLNSDAFMKYEPITQPMYFSKARAATVYYGPHSDQKVPPYCSINATGVALSERQIQRVLLRQSLHAIAVEWEWDALTSESERATDQADEVPRKKLETMLKRFSSDRESAIEEQGKTALELTNPIVPFLRPKSPYTDDVVRLMEQKLAYTLSQITQQTTTRRGLVIPLYERIARNGFSLILELRAMGITLPIEVPYCGDLQPRSIELLRTKTELGAIRAYDVCDLAARATSLENAPVFCDTLATCHTKFRSFIIKPLAVTYSQFEQILMLDADTTYFINPTVLFDSDKFQRTGILLMHDRISNDRSYMARRVAGTPERSVEQVYFATFDVTPFRPLPTLERPKASVENKMPVTLAFEPSDFLLRSHSFNLRAGHHVDSSLVFWDKHRQPRATAILASFLRHKEALPPSYGDKELYFYASELAETLYAYSDYAMGAAGTKLTDRGPNKSTLCGDMAHVFPIRRDDVRDDDVPLFSLNSDHILTFKPEVEPVYYMKARPWDHYPGPFGKRPQECPFNITANRFEAFHIEHLAQRRKFFAEASAW